MGDQNPTGKRASPEEVLALLSKKYPEKFFTLKKGSGGSHCRGDMILLEEFRYFLDKDEAAASIFPPAFIAEGVRPLEFEGHCHVCPYCGYHFTQRFKQTYQVHHT